MKLASSRQASNSRTLNALYTTSVVIRAMHAALRRLRFARGRVLESALGLGHFIGLMPVEMRERSRVIGIEIDSVTSCLAKLLCPDADIRHPPFKESRKPFCSCLTRHDGQPTWFAREAPI